MTPVHLSTACRRALCSRSSPKQDTRTADVPTFRQAPVPRGRPRRTLYLVESAPTSVLSRNNPLHRAASDVLRAALRGYDWHRIGNVLGNVTLLPKSRQWPTWATFASPSGKGPCRHTGHRAERVDHRASALVVAGLSMPITTTTLIAHWAPCRRLVGHWKDVRLSASAWRGAPSDALLRPSERSGSPEGGQSWTQCSRG